MIEFVIVLAIVSVIVGMVVTAGGGPTVDASYRPNVCKNCGKEH